MSYVFSKPLVSQTSAGAVQSAGQLLGTNTNDAAASGNVGEMKGPITRIRSNGLTLTYGTAANVCTTTSITLTAGDWDVRGAVGFTTASTSALTECEVAVSKTTGTLPSSDVFAVPTLGEFALDDAVPFTSTGNNDVNFFTIPSYQTTIANGTSQSLFLVARASGSGAQVKVYGWMEARRMR